MPEANATADALLLQLLRQQEAERHAVGKALHNQVGQALSAIKMTAHLTLDEEDAAQRRLDLQDIIHASDETVAIVRDLHAQLHPPQLETLGLDAALRAELERIEDDTGARHDASLPALPHAPSHDAALVAFRVGQSLLRALPTSGGRIALADDGAGHALQLDVEGPAPFAPVDIALWQALARAAGGTLDALHGGSAWRLRLPYAPAPASGSVRA